MGAIRTHLLLSVTLLLLACHGQAATIYGSVYDISLNRVTNVILEINSTPVQRIVAVNGTYSFELPKGEYMIQFFYPDSSEKMAIEELVAIGDSGEYHIDLVLYPDFSSDDVLSDSLDMVIEDLSDNEEGNPLLPLVTVMIMAIGILTAYWLINRRKFPKRTEEPDDKSKLLLLLRKNGGRMTQKELRRSFPYSEAKISLLVAELEANGRIQKIKRGRTNILILK